MAAVFRAVGKPLAPPYSVGCRKISTRRGRIQDKRCDRALGFRRCTWSEGRGNFTVDGTIDLPRERLHHAKRR